MNDKEFIEFVNQFRWQEAKSSPHSYIIKYWVPKDQRDRFLEAVKHVRANGIPDWWNGERYTYHRPGDGYRYWDAAPNSGPDAVVAFNRTKESGQLRLWDG